MRPSPALLAGLLWGCTTPADPVPEEEVEVPEDTAGPEEITHCGYIRADERWLALDNPHIVTCDVRVEGATLELEAGVEVRFEADHGLQISRLGEAARLLVAGSAEAPVFMGPAVEGEAWDGLAIYGEAEEVVLEHLELRGGGARHGGNLLVEGAEVRLASLTTRDSLGCGLLLDEGGRIAPDSSGLHATGNASWPLCVQLDTTHTVPTLDSSYTGNAHDAVFVAAGGTLRESATWSNPGVPYAIGGSVRLEGEDEDPVVLGLEAGTTLAFMDGGSLSLSADGGTSGLHALGSAEAPVSFTAWEDAAPGAWAGLEVHAGAEVHLEHAVVSRAGGGRHGTSLYIEDTEVHVDHLRLAHGAGDALRLAGVGPRFSEGSAGLVVEDCEALGELPASAVGSLPSEDSDYTGAGDGLLRVVGTEALTESQTWAGLGADYLLERDLLVEGTEEAPAVLTLTAGATLRFAPGASLEVGRDGPGGLRVAGTEEAPVVFTAAEAEEPGSWPGIQFHDQSIDDASILEHFEIAYGGVTLSEGNIRILAASPTIRSAWVHHSATWGIFCVGGGTSPSLEEITYSDNVEGETTCY